MDERGSGHFGLWLYVKIKKLETSERATATGFHVQTNRHLTHFILDVLKHCDITNKILHSSKKKLNLAISLIACVRDEMKEKKNEYDDDKISLIIQEKNMGCTSRPRSSYIPANLLDCVFTDPLPSCDNVNLRADVVECVDRRYGIRWSAFCHHFHNSWFLNRWILFSSMWPLYLPSRKRSLLNH